MRGDNRISHVVVAAAGTRRLVDLVRRGCASIHGSGGRLTIVSLSTRLERIAARCSLSESWLPMLQSDDLVAGRIPAFAEALLACPNDVTVDYETLVDWTTGSVVRSVLRTAPDAVVLDTRLSALCRALQGHYFRPAARPESTSPDLLLIARPQPTAY